MVCVAWIRRDRFFSLSVLFVIAAALGSVYRFLAYAECVPLLCSHHSVYRYLCGYDNKIGPTEKTQAKITHTTNVVLLLLLLLDISKSENVEQPASHTQPKRVYAYRVGVSPQLLCVCLYAIPYLLDVNPKMKCVLTNNLFAFHMTAFSSAVDCSLQF